VGTAGKLGYGRRLGTLATTHNKHLTPRYSIGEAEDANDESPVNLVLLKSRRGKPRWLASSAFKKYR
jgi:hypothetical protein